MTITVEPVVRRAREDKVVFVDRGRRIVNVVPAGTRTRPPNSDAVAWIALLRDDIRVIQRVLIGHDLLQGKADGILGAETREAISAFQRQQNIPVTGSIDARTVSRLGVSDLLSQHAKQSIGRSRPSPVDTQTSMMTQGQADNAQAPAGQPQPNHQNATGQAPDQTTKPPAQRSEPSTAGQITASNQSTTTGQAGQRTRSRNESTEDQRPLSRAISLTITGAAVGFLLLALGAFILMPVV